MKINEVEERVGISKANIRFYEKQGLISPARGSNGYREYGEEDILRLQNIIILRKLGISVQDIEKIQKGELPLQEAIQANITQLEEQIEQLTGSLKLSRQIALEAPEELDTPRYWQIIQQKEAEGERFVDVVSEYWGFIGPLVSKRLGLIDSMTFRQKLIQIIAVCAGVSAIRTFIWKEGNFILNFFYPFAVIVPVVVLGFILFWLSKSFPKTVTVVSTVLLVACVIIVGAAFLLAAGGLLLMVKDFLFR